MPENELKLLAPDLRRLSLRARQVVAHAGESPSAAYFPLDGLISVMVTMQSGQAVEAATIGHEGAFGLPSLTSASATNLEAVVQISGSALSMPVDILRTRICDCPVLAREIERYIGLYVASVAQTAGCNRLHPVEQRCARWLLIGADAVRSNSFELTHEFLAVMLGVLRPSVTLAAGTLQKAGLISYRRGKLTIVDRENLEQAACECYGVIASFFRRSEQQRLDA